MISLNLFAKQTDFLNQLNLTTPALTKVVFSLPHEMKIEGKEDGNLF